MLHITNPLPVTGYCPYLWSWAAKNKKLVPKPSRGDIFLLMDADGPYGAHHTGLVTGATEGQVQTIEGNTNDDGSDDGIGVFIRSRKISTCDYVRV